MVLVDLYNYLEGVIKDIPDPENPDEKLFKTVLYDKGQFQAIANQVDNMEFQYRFPAVFIHFTNINYLSSQYRTYDGNCITRIRYVINRYNDQDPRYQLEVIEYGALLTKAIEDSKQTAGTRLPEAFKKSYLDIPEYPNQLQAGWLDYETQITDQNGAQYDSHIPIRVITPQFTNWRDTAESHRPDVPVEGYENQIRIVEKLD